MLWRPTATNVLISTVIYSHPIAQPPMTRSTPSSQETSMSTPCLVSIYARLRPRAHLRQRPHRHPPLRRTTRPANGVEQRSSMPAAICLVVARSRTRRHHGAQLQKSRQRMRQLEIKKTLAAPRKMGLASICKSAGLKSRSALTSRTEACLERKKKKGKKRKEKKKGKKERVG